MDSTLFKYKRRKKIFFRAVCIQCYKVITQGKSFFILLLPDLPLPQLSLQLPRHRRDNNS